MSKKVLILNGHQPYPFATGRLTESLIDVATEVFQGKSYEIQYSNVLEYDVEAEKNKHQWADVLLVQYPIYWFAQSWALKKYMDDVYTAGMTDVFCKADGRSSKNPTDNYGTGGLMGDKQYMLSVTLNAPKQAFGKADEYLLQGKDLDDLLLPMHAVYRFFAMQKLPSFMCNDVIKNPSIEQDLVQFAKHLETHI